MIWSLRGLTGWLLLPLGMLIGVSVAGAQPAAVSGSEGTAKTEATAAAPAEQAPAAPAVEVDAKSREVLESVAAYFKGVQQLKVTQTFRVHMEGPQINNQTQTLTDYVFARPNRISARVTQKGMQAFGLVSDGERMLVTLQRMNAYVEKGAPADFEALSKDEDAQIVMQAGLVNDLMRPDPYQALLENVTKVDYTGLETSGSLSLHRLRFHREEAPVDVWFDAGAKPFLRRAMPDMSQVIERLRTQMPNLKDAAIKLEQDLQYSNWSVGGAVDGAAFVVKAPEGLEKAESVAAAFEQAMSGNREKNAMAGKPAPNVEMELLDGGKVKISELKGKIVVLDFWATWCAPCRRGLPIVQEVTQNFRDKGVVFYAVNIEEDAELIRSFLKDEKLSMPVGLDKDGSIAKAFGVEGAIPQTLIVGKNGVIEAAHVGISPDYKKKLTGELETLTSGGSLLTKAKK